VRGRPKPGAPPSACSATCPCPRGTACSTKEVSSGDHPKLRLDEGLPSRAPAACGRGFEAVFQQNTLHGIARDFMAEVVQGTAEACVPPARILSGHANDQPAISGFVRGRPNPRFLEPSYFAASRLRYYPSSVSGVTTVSSTRRPDRPMAFAFSARRRRCASVHRIRFFPSCSRSDRFSAWRYSITACWWRSIQPARVIRPGLRGN
jgi:hypothetical protein